jgi:serine/threonine protein kinase
LREEYSITDHTLGVGSSGAVVVAIDSLSGKQVACKILEVDLGNTPSFITARKVSEIDQDRYDSSALGETEAFRELDILKDLDHVGNVSDFLGYNANNPLAEYCEHQEGILE